MSEKYIRKRVVAENNKAENLKNNYSVRYKLRQGLKSWKQRAILCSVCKKFISVRYRIVHRRIHTGEKPYKCSNCSSTFGQRSNFVTHLKVKHQERTRLKCIICGNLVIRSLRRHILEVHGTNRKFKCKRCPKTFSLQGVFTQHLLRHQKRFQCDTCGMNFASAKELENHRTVHSGNKNFPCPICHRLFAREQYVRNLIHRVHEKIKSSQCRYCIETFTNSASRNSHERHRHGRGEKLFSCISCDMIFFRNTELKKHNKRHDNDRQFKCLACLKSFYAAHELRDHLLRHAGVRQFQCNFCDEAFVTRHDATAHMRKKHPTR